MQGAQETGSWKEGPIPLCGNLQKAVFPTPTRKPIDINACGQLPPDLSCRDTRLRIIHYSLLETRGHPGNRLWSVCLLRPFFILLTYYWNFQNILWNSVWIGGFDSQSFFFFLFLVLYFSFQRKSIHLVNKTNDSWDVQALCQLPYSPWYLRLIEWGRSVEGEQKGPGGRALWAKRSLCKPDSWL